MLCNNILNGARADVREHLIISRIVKNNTHWLHHGESAAKKQTIDQNEEGKEPGDLSQTKEKEQGDPSQKKRKERSDNMFEIIYDAAGCEFTDDSSGVKFKQGDALEPTSKIFKLVEDVAQQLYPGCETFSKYSIIVELLQIKCLYGLSDKAVDIILKLIKRALPSDETLPETFYEAKKVIQDLGFRYENIHACKNDCMLFWKENAKFESCLICGESRWKSVEGQKTDGVVQGKIKE
ncbi:hypothetical protein T459_26904 [Capsicum annuum]|uniref:Uncharacterized protein n=1 Tax=Capsicum annuum TaxID=4072 RepID=A0A2G2YCD1_CAPAN|nr:hypothetical protein T459_26904 [Capsicum annuum]